MTKNEVQKQEAALPVQSYDFGGVADMPMGSTPPKIIIDKDRAKFDMGHDKLYDELYGHIILTQAYNRYFSDAYDPGNPGPPECYSADGIHPSGGSDMLPGPCLGCPNNAFNTRDDGSKYKPCQNRMLVFFLREGDAMASMIDLKATSLNPNQKDGILQFAGKAINYVSAETGQRAYQLCRVKLVCQLKSYARGQSSILVIQLAGAEKDAATISEIYRVYQEVKRIKDHMVAEAAAEVEAFEEPPI